MQYTFLQEKHFKNLLVQCDFPRTYIFRHEEPLVHTYCSLQVLSKAIPHNYH